MSKASIIGAYNTAFGALVRRDKLSGLVNRHLDAAAAEAKALALSPAVK